LLHDLAIGTDRDENIACHNSFIVAGAIFVMLMSFFLLRRNLATALSLVLMSQHLKKLMYPFKNCNANVDTLYIVASFPH
jgi:hypothetical protein